MKSCSPACYFDVVTRTFGKFAPSQLKTLWKKAGVKTLDVATNTELSMRALLLWTISDFPARSSLSGLVGSGLKGLSCPYIYDETPSTRMNGKSHLTSTFALILLSIIFCVASRSIIESDMLIAEDQLVFYLEDPSRSHHWKVVQRGQSSNEFGDKESSLWMQCCSRQQLIDVALTANLEDLEYTQLSGAVPSTEEHLSGPNAKQVEKGMELQFKGQYRNRKNKFKDEMFVSRGWYENPVKMRNFPPPGKSLSEWHELCDHFTSNAFGILQ
ncbi:formin-like protein 18 [Tanacetum coccineum]|uniref:Formin-like protein 18 n=1 Tax=Tanacetum coccineum TaxID=301880 RepID=A0ABQ4WIT0_9ASTR